MATENTTHASVSAASTITTTTSSTLLPVTPSVDSHNTNTPPINPNVTKFIGGDGGDDKLLKTSKFIESRYSDCKIESPCCSSSESIKTEYQKKIIQCPINKSMKTGTAETTFAHIHTDDKPNDDYWSPLVIKSWQDLTKMEKTAAVSLGYTETTWPCIFCLKSASKMLFRHIKNNNERCVFDVLYACPHDSVHELLHVRDQHGQTPLMVSLQNSKNIKITAMLLCAEGTTFVAADTSSENNRVKYV